MAPLREVLGDTFLGLDHLGIAVIDLDAAIAHWATLGVDLTHRETNLDQGVDEAMATIPHGPALQLLEATAPDTAVGKFLTTFGPGLQQIAFRVSNVEEAAERVRAAGMRALYGQPRAGTAGSRINFIHPKDVGAMLVELVEHV